MSATDPGTGERVDEAALEDVRRDLRRLGYLDHGVERFLLQDALRPERPLRTALLLSLKVGLLAGALLAVLGALLLAALNGLLRSAPFDVIPLFLHLVPPLALAVGLAFLALSGVLALILHLSHTRRIETVSFAVAVVTVLAALVFLGRGAAPLLAALERWQQAALAVLVAVLVAALVKVVHGGLLGLSIRLSDRAPERRTSRWLWRVLLIAGPLALLLLPAVLDVGRAGARAPASLPTRPGARVALIGVDGVLAAELAFLRAGGELPALETWLDAGAAWLAYPRSTRAPASFWTTVATGIGEPDHGMVSLESFEPLGLSRALTRSGWLRPYWARVAVPTGLARYRPVLAHNRRAPAFWELAARGGVPVVAVDWWGTFPARAETGLVVAHGAYQLLGRGVEAAAAPVAALPSLVAMRDGLPPPPILARFAAVLDGNGDGAGGSERLAAVRDKVLLPDDFYRAVFTRAVFTRALAGEAPAAAALYLPALDIAAGLIDARGVAFGDLVRWQLREVDRLLATLAGDAPEGSGYDAVAVVFDPGRRAPAEGGEGRVLLWRPGGCAPRGDTEPAAVASALLRALGLPQSRELPPPPGVCPWPAPSLTVDTYGSRDPEPGPEPGEDYLDNLKSLGYL